MSRPIAAGEVFDQQAFSADETRAMLEKLLRNVEEQRLVAWATWRAAPEEGEAAKKYRKLCKEQSRLAAAVAEWSAANPEDTEIEERD